jgi:ribosomal protein S18 acetylase RimI-like enzyme
MQIRQADEEDLDGMLAVLRAVLVPGDTLPFLETTSKEDFRSTWLGGGQCSWVAVTEAALVGMYAMGANRSGRGSHVASATYAVHPAAQGRGIGRALVEHSLAEAAHAGFLAMQFNYVVSTNIAAIRLYENLGFDIVGTLPKAFRHETLGLVDAYVMYRFL